MHWSKLCSLELRNMTLNLMKYGEKSVCAQNQNPTQELYSGYKSFVPCTFLRPYIVLIYLSMHYKKWHQ